MTPPGIRRRDAIPIVGSVLGLGVVGLAAIVLASTTPQPWLGPRALDRTFPASQSEVSAKPSPLVAPRDLSTGSYRGPSFGPGGDVRPTVEKPQSKLWFHASRWWGALLHRPSSSFHIFELDWDTQTWEDTGVMIDERSNARLDALADGDRLYIVAAGRGPFPSHAARFYRFRYDAEAGYRLDDGFPVELAHRGVLSPVIARDTAGWMWMVDVVDRRVRIAHTEGDDATWSSAEAMPVPGGEAPTGVASVISAGGSTFVLWAAFDDDAVLLATHSDGDPADRWTGSTAPVEGVRQADDHLNLKAIELDDGWHVYAVLKTSLDDAPRANPLDPQIEVLELKPDGTRTMHLAGRIRDRHTRAMLLLDEDARRMFVVAANPFIGGRVYIKASPLDRISLPTGRGAILIRSRDDLLINDPTSTKQNLTRESGLVVLAADASTGHYVHGAMDLGETPLPRFPMTLPPVP